MLLTLLFALAVTTWLGCHVYRKVALRLHFLDHPNSRSAHVEPTPTGAGIVFVTLFYVVLYTAWTMQIVSIDVFLATLGGIPVAVIGLADDVKTLPWPVRAVVHILAATWCIYWVGFPAITLFDVTLEAGFISLVFGVVALVWLLNLYNFMDGIDGIAAVEAMFVCGAVVLLAGLNREQWSLVNMVLGTVSLGFLIINWPNAKVFMGDIGSGFLGLMLGVLVLAYQDLSVWTLIILLAYFVTDASLTIVTRLVRGERIYEAHSQHAYQHLARALGDAKVLYIVLAINILWLLPLAALSVAFPEYGALLLILASLPLLIGEFACGAGQLAPRISILNR